jgi:hypothetical protein
VFSRGFSAVSARLGFCTARVLETEADHDQFMNWWNVAGSYFRECANAFDARP